MPGAPTNLTPAEPAMRDGAMAETRDDLDKLLRYAREKLPHMDADSLTDTLVRGFLAQPEWGDLELATVLGLAVVRLAATQVGTAPKPAERSFAAFDVATLTPADVQAMSDAQLLRLAADMAREDPPEDEEDEALARLFDAAATATETDDLDAHRAVSRALAVFGRLIVGAVVEDNVEAAK